LFEDAAKKQRRGRIKLIAATSLSIGVLICGRLLTFFRPPFFHSG
jgi:hypothetical protein